MMRLGALIRGTSACVLRTALRSHRQRALTPARRGIKTASQQLFNRRRFRWATVGAIGVSSAAALCFQVDTANASFLGGSSPKQQALEVFEPCNNPGPRQDVPLRANFIADASEKVAPAVVNIKAAIADGWGNMRGQSSGSGFIVHSDGLILTNAHVIADHEQLSSGVQITLQDGRKLSGKVLSFDTVADVAVIQAQTHGEALPTVKMGCSSQLRVGEWVVALGSPIGLSNSVTTGIVSNIDRPSTELGIQGKGTLSYIQTDAAINVGNSGGPLVNIEGEVIGINTMTVQGSAGISFAIPIDTAKDVAKQLISKGRVQRPWIGIRMIPVSKEVVAELRRRGNAIPDVQSGVIIAGVIPGSPADHAGLQPGDVITSFAAKDISTSKDVIQSLEGRVNERVDVDVARSNQKTGREETIRLKLTPKETPRQSRL